MPKSKCSIWKFEEPSSNLHPKNLLKKFLNVNIGIGGFLKGEELANTSLNFCIEFWKIQCEFIQTIFVIKNHNSDIRNTRIFWRCSKRSIFKYFKIWKCEYVKYVNTMSKTLSKLSLSCAQTQRQRWSSIFKYFFKSPKKHIIRVCLNRIESMSLLCKKHQSYEILKKVFWNCHVK
jgi:hypothetical protein